MNTKPPLVRRGFLQVLTILFAVTMTGALAVYSHRKANRGFIHGTKSTQVLEDLRLLDAAVDAAVESGQEHASLQKSGSGVLVLSGTKSYSGLSNVLSGSLQVRNMPESRSATATEKGFEGDRGTKSELILRGANAFAGMQGVKSGTLFSPDAAGDIVTRVTRPALPDPIPDAIPKSTNDVTVFSTGKSLSAGTLTFGSRETIMPGVKSSGIFLPFVHSNLLFDVSAAGWQLTGLTTNGTTTVTVASTAGLTPGLVVVGPNIPLGATVTSITNGTQFVISVAATGNTASPQIGAAGLTLPQALTAAPATRIPAPAPRPAPGKTP